MVDEMAKSPSISHAAVPRRRGRPPRVGKDDILAVALDLFARRGYRGTTLAAIAEAIGVTDASILHYFDSKPAILEAVLAQDEEVANREFLERLAPGGLEALRRVAEWGARMEAHPATTRLQIVLTAEALGEGSELHGEFEKRYRYIRQRLIRAIQRGIDAGEIRSDTDAVYEATALWAFLDGLRVQWFYAEGDLSLDQHLRTYVDHLIERIAAPIHASSRRARA
jgi:AcrR family transcriptional regulator